MGIIQLMGCTAWRIIPGLGCVVNNHGYCSCCTLRIGLWDFFPNGRTPWLLNVGDPHQSLTGMILQVWFRFPPKSNRLWVAFMASRRSGMIVSWQDFSVRENYKVGPKTRCTHPQNPKDQKINGLFWKRKSNFVRVYERFQGTWLTGNML